MENNMFYNKYKKRLEKLFYVLDSTFENKSAMYFDALDKALNNANRDLSTHLTKLLESAAEKNNMTLFNETLNEIEDNSIYKLEIYTNALITNLKSLQKSYTQHVHDYNQILIKRLKPFNKPFDFKHYYDLFFVYIKAGRFETAQHVMDTYFDQTEVTLYKDFGIYLIHNKYTSIEDAKHSKKRIIKDKFGSVVYKKYLELKKSYAKHNIFILEDIQEIVEYQEHRVISRMSAKQLARYERKKSLKAFSLVVLKILWFILYLAGIFGLVVGQTYLYVYMNKLGYDLLYRLVPFGALMIGNLLWSLIFRYKRLYFVISLILLILFIVPIYDPTFMNSNESLSYFELLEDVVSTQIQANTIEYELGIHMIDNLRTLTNYVYRGTYLLGAVLITLIAIHMRSKYKFGDNFKNFKKFIGILLVVMLFVGVGYSYYATEFVKATYFDVLIPRLAIVIISPLILFIFTLFFMSKLIGGKAFKRAKNWFILMVLIIVVNHFYMLTEFKPNTILQSLIILFIYYLGMILPYRLLKKYS